MVLLPVAYVRQPALSTHNFEFLMMFSVRHLIVAATVLFLEMSIIAVEGTGLGMLLVLGEGKNKVGASYGCRNPSSCHRKQTDCFTTLHITAVHSYHGENSPYHYAICIRLARFSFDHRLGCGDSLPGLRHISNRDTQFHHPGP